MAVYDQCVCRKDVSISNLKVKEKRESFIMKRLQLNRIAIRKCELSGTNLIVKISYHYKASYYDCAYTGGYVYTMVQGTV